LLSSESYPRHHLVGLVEFSTECPKPALLPPLGDGTDPAQYKITLQMDHLSCKTPENLRARNPLHFLVQTWSAALMLEAARRYSVPLERVSFAGSLAAARRYSEASCKPSPKLAAANCKSNCSGFWLMICP